MVDPGADCRQGLGPVATIGAREAPDGVARVVAVYEPVPSLTEDNGRWLGILRRGSFWGNSWHAPVSQALRLGVGRMVQGMVGTRDSPWPAVAIFVLSGLWHEFVCVVALSKLPTGEPVPVRGSWIDRDGEVESLSASDPVGDGIGPDPSPGVEGSLGWSLSQALCGAVGWKVPWLGGRQYDCGGSQFLFFLL